MFSEEKQVHVGMEASKTNQTRCERHHNTFTPSLHLVPFCQLCTPQTLYMHLAYSYALNEQGTQLCSLHSLTHKRRPMSAMFSSNKTSQHNLNSNIYHTDPALLMHSTVSAYSQDRPYLPCSVQQLHWSNPQHNSLSMHLKTHYIPTTIHPTAYISTLVSKKKKKNPW